MLVTFSSNIGSFETLKEFVRCGFSPAAAQILPSLDGEMPIASAIRLRVQWVALRGLSCTVFAITRSRIEARMRCLKSFGERIAARDPDRQTAEIHIRIALMNSFSALGTAEIVRMA